MKYSDNTIQRSGRATSRYAGESVARVIAVGRIPSQSVIEDVEKALGVRVISQHAVSDWIEQDDPCASAHQIRNALKQVLSTVESPHEHIVLVMSPFAMSSVIAALVIRSEVDNKMHIVHYKYQHRELICLDASCLSD